MEQLVFSGKKEEEILERIEKKAESYTPEWRFDRENPDAGTVLSMVFANMLAKSYEKMGFLPMKNKIEFFNRLGACMLPAEPSRGWVEFSAVNREAPVQEVLAGAGIICRNEEEREIYFETLDDLSVTGAALTNILFSCAKSDYIGEAYDGKKPAQDIKLFSFEKENLQEHILYFMAGRVLGIKSGGEISIKLYLRDEAVDIKKLMECLEGGGAFFEYSAGGGYYRMNPPVISEDGISFVISENDPVFEEREEMGQKGYWLRLSLPDYKKLEGFCFDRVILSSCCKKKRPEIIFAEGEEADLVEFYPFGQHFTNYSEAYIASGEVFGKRGAEITISFYMEYEEEPINGVKKESKELEWIMKKSDFKTEPEYDITIEEVVWEYYNGSGWAVIPGTEKGRRFFSYDIGRPVRGCKTISFTCPKDICPILINSKESYYVRIRVLKVNNFLKQNGKYIYPVIKNISLCYDYKAALIQADYIFTLNNKEIKEYKLSTLKKGQALIPFYGLVEEYPAVYFGFDRAFCNGIYKIMFDVGERRKQRDRPLLWEYFNGTRWKELDVVDETENFSRPGIVTILAGGDFECFELYGYRGCWLRVSDISGRGNLREKEDELPLIRGIYLNSVKVRCTSPGGEYTNAGEGRVSRMVKSMRYIRGVTNPKKMTGGRDAENMQEALKRNAGAIRHQNMAVTIRDFEEIAGFADRTIQKVKCLRGYDENEEKKSGAVTLVVLLCSYREEFRDFYEVKLKILNHLKEKINSSIWDLNRLYIREPYFIEFNVSVKIAVGGMEDVFMIKKKVQRRLEVFLDPVSGNFDNSGWDIGVLPNMQQLKNAIRGIEGVKYIKDLLVTAYLKEGSTRREIDINTMLKSRYVLPDSGCHDVIAVV